MVLENHRIVYACPKSWLRIGREPVKAGRRIQVLAAIGSTSCMPNILGDRTCGAESVKDELQHIKHVFRQNEYVIVTSDERTSQQEPSFENKSPTSICKVPYQQTISIKSVDFSEIIISGRFRME